ncbi:MAG: hypothetical protein IIA66_07260, partial [Planctomycetes bacterium]|nr:hypothetical protein [Planctomycetota bacterium]
MTNTNSIVAALAMAVGLFLAPGSARAQTTWFVDDDGTPGNGCTSWADACPDLQTALALASSDAQIWVAVGSYTPAEAGGER